MLCFLPLLISLTAIPKVAILFHSVNFTFRSFRRLKYILFSMGLNHSDPVKIHTVFYGSQPQ